MAPICPYCGREAPIVYRGVVPACTACGALRVPLSSPSVNLAGKPSQVGGTVASVFGWLILTIGGSLALGIALLILALHASAGIGLAIDLPLAIVVLALGIPLVRGGHSLHRSGAHAERQTRDQALLGLLAHRGGVRAGDAARVLNVGVVQADAMLTELAKREPDRVTVDIDDHGAIWYRAATSAGELDARLRVGDRAGVRVAVHDDLGESDGAAREGGGARQGRR